MTFARELVEVVELVQPRCSRRFGALPCRAALITGETRTNVVHWSEDWTRATWTKAAMTVAANVASAPDGTSTMDRLVPSTANTTHYAVAETYGYSAGTTYTLSVYAKADGYNFIWMTFPSGAFPSGARGASFNLSSGAVDGLHAGVTAHIEAIGSGIYRCSISRAATSTATQYRAGIGVNAASSPAGGAVTFAGDGTSGVLVWGAQMEIGAGASTYKKTGAADVTETWGQAAAKCHNTWGTCADRDHIDTAGSLTWRFCRPGDRTGPLYERDGDDVKTNALPLLDNFSAGSAEINVAAQRTGVSPLGIGATATATFRNMPWHDPVGDWYRDDRGAQQGTFWGKWRARNAFPTGMMMRHYVGQAGQALIDMTRRDYVVDQISAASNEGATFQLVDPLRLTEARDAKFPPQTEIELVGDIDALTVSVRVAADEADLSIACGNTGARRYLTIGAEIILYTGWTLVETGIYDLTGVRRGQLDTTAASHDAGEAAQRAGRYERLQLWRIAADLIDNHTPIPAGYRDGTAWDTEGWARMITARATRTIPSPKAVETLLGELCQQGGFSIWWDERQRTIRLLANRPPEGTPRQINETNGIVAGTVAVSDGNGENITRVIVYYGPRSPFDSGKPENYRTVRAHIDGYVESDAALAAVKSLVIYADWVTGRTAAMRLAARILLRYRLIPVYLAFAVDGKDDDISVGDVLDVTTSAIEDAEGAAVELRWQVIRAESTEAGHLATLKLQSHRYIGRFAVIMPASAPDYDAATADERANGCWLAVAATGKMPKGDEPYLLQ